MYKVVTTLADPIILLYWVVGFAVLSLWWKRRPSRTSDKLALAASSYLATPRPRSCLTAPAKPGRSVVFGVSEDSPRGQSCRRRLFVLTGAFFLLCLLSTPLASNLALQTLENPYPPMEHRPKEARAIVVLGGSIRATDPTRTRFLPTTDTFYRCLRAVELYREGPPCPILLSGGKTTPDPEPPAIAEVMRDVMRTQGIRDEDLIIETTSRNTYENAVECRKILEERKIDKVILVTDATHLYRAVACFRKQNVDVIPCGCRYQSRPVRFSPQTFLPNPGSATGFQVAWHEWLGVCWYALCGRI